VGSGLLCLAMIGCGGKPPADEPPSSPGMADAAAPRAAAARSIAGPEWVLVLLGERPAPTGAGGRPATIQFDSTSSRAAGFAGCNRFSGDYTLGSGSLRFGPVVSTKMACAEGDELERRFLGALPRVTTYAAADSTLTLGSAEGPLLRFVAR
jgi:heat shock protein HslJ